MARTMRTMELCALLVVMLTACGSAGAPAAGSSRAPGEPPAGERTLPGGGRTGPGNDLATPRGAGAGQAGAAGRPGSRATGAPAPNLTAVPASDAAVVIQTYAQEMLGISVQVTQARGVSGPLTVAPTLSTAGSQSMQAAVHLAMAAYAGRLSGGVGVVAYGSGQVSGDLTADIEAASLGAFSLQSSAGYPDDAAAALDLVKRTFPALARLNLAAQTTTDGYAFYVTDQTTTVNPRTQQAEVTALAALVGVLPGSSVIVYVVLGTGDFAATIQP